MSTNPRKSGTQSDVGYGKPPKATRFKKGKSGNPAGRPKGKLNVATTLAKALAATVVVSEGGRRVTKTKFEVTVTQVVNKAAGGDLKAIKMVMDMMWILDPAGAEAAMPPDLVADRELAMKLIARLARQKSGDADDTDQSYESDESNEGDDE